MTRCGPRQDTSSMRQTGDNFMVKILVCFIHEHCRNGDQQLSKQEVLDSQHVFVASQATAYGKALAGKDEL